MEWFSKCRQRHVLHCAHKISAVISPFLCLIFLLPPLRPGMAGGQQHPKGLRREEHIHGGFFLLALGSAWHHFYMYCTPCFFFIKSSFHLNELYMVCFTCWVLGLPRLYSSRLRFYPTVTAQNNLLLWQSVSCRNLYVLHHMLIQSEAKAKLKQVAVTWSLDHS